MIKFIRFFFMTYFGMLMSRFILTFLIEVIGIKTVTDFIDEHPGLFQTLFVWIGAMIIYPGGIDDSITYWAVILGLLAFLIVGFNGFKSKS